MYRLHLQDHLCISVFSCVSVVFTHVGNCVQQHAHSKFELCSTQVGGVLGKHLSLPSTQLVLEEPFKIRGGVKEGGQDFPLILTVLADECYSNRDAAICSVRVCLETEGWWRCATVTLYVKNILDTNYNQLAWHCYIVYIAAQLQSCIHTHVATDQMWINPLMCVNRQTHVGTHPHTAMQTWEGLKTGHISTSIPSIMKSFFVYRSSLALLDTYTVQYTHTVTLFLPHPPAPWIRGIIVK